MRSHRSWRPPAAAMVAGLAMLAAGCGGGGEQPEPGPPSLAPGVHDLTFEEGGRSHSYLLFVPSSYDPERPTPLMVVLHGRPSNSWAIAGVTGMSDLAEQEGFLVAYPDNFPDVEPVHALVDRLADDWNVAAGAIFAAGFSAGGSLSWQLGVRHSETFAAVGSVAGPYFGADQPPAQPVSAISIVGLADRGWLNRVENGLANWREQQDCTADEPAWLTDDELTSRTVAQCRDGSELVEYRVDVLGHRWPPTLSPEVDTNETIWEFFTSHRRG